MSAPTKVPRRQRLAEINVTPDFREPLNLEHGKAWDRNEFETAFTATYYLAPQVGGRQIYFRVIEHVTQIR